MMRFSIGRVQLILLVVVVVLSDYDTVALPTRVLSYDDPATVQGFNMMCDGLDVSKRAERSRMRGWDELLADESCVDEDISVPILKNSIDDLRVGRFRVLYILVHAAAQRDGKQLHKIPNITYKQGDKYKWLPYKQYTKMLRRMNTHDGIIFHLSCNTDSRKDEGVKQELSNIRSRIHKHHRPATDDDEGVRAAHLYAQSSPWAPTWQHYLQIEDTLLRIKPDQFYSATLDEVATYLMLREHLKDMDKGLIVIHQQTGQHMYNVKTFKNAVKYLRSAKHIWDLPKTILRRLKEENDITDTDDGWKGKNFFQATISSSLVPTMDIIRFCRSGMKRRAKSDRVLNAEVVRECMGSNDNTDYDKFMQCCVSKHLHIQSNQKSDVERAVARHRRRVEKKQKKSSPPTTTANILKLT